MGNMGRSLIKSIISKHIKHFPWLTRHMVNHYIATHPDGQPIGRVIVTHTNNHTVVSGLTDSSPVTRVMQRHNNDAVVIKLQPQQITTPTGASTVSTTATEATDRTSIIGDRPQGTTITIDAHTTLVADVLDKCKIEIASLK
jgi:hypothetical protein